MRIAALAAVLGIPLAIFCATPQPLCTHGHPVKRAAGVTYGGLPVRPGYQRDHWCPLGLGCPDTPENVHYQRCDGFGPFGHCLAGPAHEKDSDEYVAIEKFCSGKWTNPYARQWLADRWPLDAEHGF